METRFTTCTFCDGGCRLRVEIDDGGKRSIFPANPNRPALCSKARKVDEYRFHPDRIVKPLKNIGVRGEAQWAEVPWDEALDEIAQRLQQVIAAYGPEAVAFAEDPLNHGYGGITRRLMNYIGTPNYTAPQELCMGNTAQVHRAVYGWFAKAAWDKTDCIVYFGQDRDMERWPAEYLELKAALKRGAKLIVVDPRLSGTAKLADYHVPIRYGTDAALLLSWINVIIEEELYDRRFVEKQCFGFEGLRVRASAYPPERVADICNISADLIRETARTYAQSDYAIIPWGVVADMQVNSTSVIHAQCILRAICGFLNVSEMVAGPALGGLGNAQVAAFDKLGGKQRAKQLGRDMHPLLTFAASELYTGANARFGIGYVPDILAESNACDPSSLFKAMRGEGPYDVKAIIVAANNTVMSYAGQQGIVDAFMNQSLVVAFENWMSPTAQLADFVLPGDMWAERTVLGPAFDVGPVFTCSQAICEPVGECRSWYFVVNQLADRLGFADAFPWEEEADYCNWRLQQLNVTWNGLLESASKPVFREAPARGRFVTPSGKVELRSSVIEALGFDPLPAYQEPMDPAAETGEYPYVLFAGLRERKSYNTCLHQIKSLRELEPEPQVFINPADAAREGIAEGAWCEVSSSYGRIQLQAHLDDAQPTGTLRIPHGWWKPETKQGLNAGLGGALLYNDGMLFPDKQWNLDGLQGVANLRGGIHGNVRPFS